MAFYVYYYNSVRRTLVLDLDETLIHTFYDDTKPGNLTLYPTSTGIKETVHMKIRPHT